MQHDTSKTTQKPVHVHFEGCLLDEAGACLTILEASLSNFLVLRRAAGGLVLVLAVRVRSTKGEVYTIRVLRTQCTVVNYFAGFTYVL